MSASDWGEPEPIEPAQSVSEDPGWSNPIPMQNELPAHLGPTEGQRSKAHRSLIHAGDKGFDTAVSLAQGNIAFALEHYKGVPSNVAARADKLAKKLQIKDHRFVMRNEKDLEEFQQAQEVLERLFVQNKDGSLKYPRTVGWIQAPENMAKAKDHIKVITELEGLVRGTYAGFAERAAIKFSNTSKQIVSGGLSSVGAMIEQGARVIAGDEAEDYVDEEDYRRSDGTFDSEGYKTELDRAKRHHDKDPLIELGKAGNDAYSAIATSAFLQPLNMKEGGTVEEFAADFVGMAPQMIVQSLAFMAGGGVLSAATMAAQVGGGGYSEDKLSGVSHTDSFTPRAVSSLAQGALDAIGLSKLFRMMNKAPGARNAIWNNAIASVESFSTEVTTETGQNVLEALTKSYTTALKDGSDNPMLSALSNTDMPETLKQGLYEGLVAGTYSLLGGSAKMLAAGQQRMQFNRDNTFFEKLRNVVGKLKGSEALVEEIVEEHVKESKDAPDTTYVPVDALEEFSQDQSPDWIYEWGEDVGLDRAQIDAALKSRADIEIPTSKYASKVMNTDLDTHLRSLINYRAEGLSEADAAKQKERLTAEIAEVKAEIARQKDQAQWPENFKQLRADLIAEGIYSAGEATSAVETTLAGATVLGKQRGETAEQTLDRWNVRVVRGADGAAVIQAIPKTESELAAAAQRQETTVVDPLTDLAQINQQAWAGATVEVEVKDADGNATTDADGNAATEVVQAGPALTEINSRLNKLQALIDCLKG